ncbi:hypothetical protein FC959_16985 [Clostridium botulinum]|nr:hypothetical protein [Clostridium botulinum]
MFFKKNYFVKFQYEGPKEKGTCSTTIRCIPCMVNQIPNELRKILRNMGHEVNKVYITDIKQI